MLSIIITSTKAFENQINAFDKTIAAQMEFLSNILTFIPDIGPIYSSGIIAEIGDINRFENQSQLVNTLGFAWTNVASKQIQITRLIKSDNHFLR